MTEQIIRMVWEKGVVVTGFNSNLWRKDKCGAWIERQEYGNRDSLYGWEIDHIKPESEDGSDEISNLRPLQWRNNAAKQDGRLECPVTASGNQNIEAR